MSPPDPGVGANIGQAAIASSTAIDLSAHYADLDGRWQLAVADAVAAAGQPTVRAAVQSFGERHVSVLVALMAHTGALSANVDAATQSSVDADQSGAASMGEVLGALSIPSSGEHGR